MTPLNRARLFDQIGQILWQMIKSGEILPGQRISDLDWAQRLQVSRTPVREALRKLEQEGILIPHPSGGYSVRSVAYEDLVNLYKCRAAMEALAVEEVTAFFDEAASAPVQQIIDACEHALRQDDFETVFALNTKFHAALLGLSRNDHLKAMCQSLSHLIIFYRVNLLNQALSSEADSTGYRERLWKKHQHHIDIVAAMRAGQAALASHLMEAHIRATVDLPPRVTATVAPPDQATAKHVA